METTMTALSYPENHPRAMDPRRGGRNGRARPVSRSPEASVGPLPRGDLPVRVLVAFEVGYRSYRDTIAAAVGELRPQAEVTVAGPIALRAEVARVSPHLVISSQQGAPDPARTTAWVRLPHEPGLAGEICLGGRCVETHDVGLMDLLEVFDEVEALIRA